MEEDSFMPSVEARKGSERALIGRKKGAGKASTLELGPPNASQTLVKENTNRLYRERGKVRGEAEKGTFDKGMEKTTGRGGMNSGGQRTAGPERKRLRHILGK